jgi:glycosyltransferase involved in cell wall biosynthesis
MKIKVLYILNRAIMGGATISFLNMIEGLAAYGVEPIVVIPRNDHHGEELLRYLQEHHITFYQTTLTATSLHKPTSILHFLRICLSGLLMYLRKVSSYFELQKIVRKEKPDIIHTNVGIIREGLTVARKAGIPHILHIREYQNKDFGWMFVPSRKSYERFVRRSDAIITITDDLRSYFHLQGMPKAKTIYNGIYPKDSTILNHEKQPYFLCACRIVPGKGYEDVIEAFSRFYEHHPEYELRIAGQGDSAYLNRLKKMIDKKTCKDNIRFLGHVSNVRPLMAEATALLVASRSEGFGRMTAEACFNGCLVIGRNTAGTKEILSVTGGFLFDDLQTMVNNMEKVCHLSADEYLLIAEAAQEKAKELYSIESNTEQIYQVYNQLISKRT